MSIPKITSTIRMRIGHHDAHYAGNLVDGAKMLQVFGDLATEVLIKLDGDEGLFRAYESVEFLAPVSAGDYIEATAELIEMGNTSRKIKFEAKKVVRLLETNDKEYRAPSSAEFLDKPVIVCKAVGTCVTPKSLKRF
jgi:acyl-CoA hydrolase